MPPVATVADGMVERGFMKAGFFKYIEGNLISIAEFQGGVSFRLQ